MTSFMVSRPKSYGQRGLESATTERTLSSYDCLHTKCLQSSPPIQSHLMADNTTLRSASQSTQIRANDTPIHDLPDILNSHLPPPPYSTLPPNGLQLPYLSSLPRLVERGRNTPIRAPPPPPPPPPLPVAGRPPLPSRRLLQTPTAVLAQCSRPNYLMPACAVSDTETSASKTCLNCNGVSIRWFILLIAFIGLLCAIIGTILGALRTTGRENLTLALLMIGVGIILITVSGIAWRLTSSGPTWRSILGLHELHPQQSLCNGSSLNDTTRRFVPRVPAPYGRTGSHHHPYGAMFYPEFQYRPPPPSYQASMQEYRLRLLLLDRSSSHTSHGLHPSHPSHPPHHTPQSTSLSPVSPPPTYRSSASNQSSLTNHDINRVTILQTTNTSQVCTPNGVNIVAISPTNTVTNTTTTTTTTATTTPNVSTSCTPIVTTSRIQILAHV